MKQALSIKVNLEFSQVLQIVKQLPTTDKIKLSKELEKEIIDSKLSRLLKSFKTDELTYDIIDNECEAVREEIFSKPYGK